MKRALTLIMLLPALLLAGCASAQSSPQSVAESYLKALADHDYATACSYLDPSVTEVLEARCEQNLEDGVHLSGNENTDLSTLKFDKVEEISDSEATVYFTIEEETVPVTTTQVDGKWYVKAG